MIRKEGCHSTYFHMHVCILVPELLTLHNTLYNRLKHSPYKLGYPLPFHEVRHHSSHFYCFGFQGYVREASKSSARIMIRDLYEVVMLNRENENIVYRKPNIGYSIV
jgi:hypothetical protein